MISRATAGTESVMLTDLTSRYRTAGRPGGVRHDEREDKKEREEKAVSNDDGNTNDDDDDDDFIMIIIGIIDITRITSKFTS
jgi:hypothetical protein